VYAQRADTGTRPVRDSVTDLLAREKAGGVLSEDYYRDFEARAQQVKNGLLGFLLETRSSGERIAGYGAAAKGNTLLNYAGVRPDLLPYVVDRNPAKQEHFLPGSRVPVVDEDRLASDKPDWVLLLPWNLKHELVEQLAYVRAWGGRFVTAVPEVEIS
jgi:hypothetical protein